MARSLLTNSDTYLLVFSTSGPSEVIHDDTLSGNATNSAYNFSWGNDSTAATDYGNFV